MQVMLREGTGPGGSGSGSGWLGGLGKMVALAVGTEVGGEEPVRIPPQTVWGLNRAEEVFVRIGVSAAEPRGKDWTKIDGNFRNIRWEEDGWPAGYHLLPSVGPSGACWAVDRGDTVWRRLGAQTVIDGDREIINGIGTKWQMITGRLRMVTVGLAGIWGVTPDQEVLSCWS